jgi:hypothetical protein
MGRVFKTRAFTRFVRRERIADEALCEAIARADRGLIDADLGGGVIKQRVARPGQGRSGGFRTLIAFKAARRSVFIFGFAKSTMDNISHSELEDLRHAAKVYMGLSEHAIDAAVAEDKLSEVECDGEEVQKQDFGGRARGHVRPARRRPDR